MKKKLFTVTCTIVYNGSMQVEAESEDEAVSKVQEQLSYHAGSLPSDLEAGDATFFFGEATADYAEQEF